MGAQRAHIERSMLERCCASGQLGLFSGPQIVMAGLGQAAISLRFSVLLFCLAWSSFSRRFCLLCSGFPSCSSRGSRYPSAACSRTWLYSSISLPITRSACKELSPYLSSLSCLTVPLHRSTIPFDSGCLTLVRMSRRSCALTTARSSLLQNSLP